MLSICREPRLPLTFSVNSKALTAEDTNVQSILLGSSPNQPMVSYDRTLEALIAFSWHRCDIKPSLEIANHTVKRAKASEIKGQLFGAWRGPISNSATISSLTTKSQEAYHLFNTHLSDDLESQRLGGQCGIDLVDAARATLVQDSSMAVSLAGEVERKCAALSDNVIHSRSLVILGSFLDQALQRQGALQHLNRAT